MTEPLFFCSQTSRESGVDIIGSAPEHQLYVAIECPPPWDPYDLDSKGVPDNLRTLGEEIYDNYDRFQTRFLLIHSERLKQANSIRVLFFRKPSGLSNAYEKQEFLLNDIQDVAAFVKSYVMGEPIDRHPIDNPTRDILICTHGSRDRCCARFGNPIYQQALKIVEERSLSDVRIWQASHIGGHRMAPTAITFPDARYYGYLTPDVLTTILTRTGDLDWLHLHYRGCGMLPWAVQWLERQLIKNYGWNWFCSRLYGHVLDQNDDESINHVELVIEIGNTGNQLEVDQHRYTATVRLDDQKIIHLKSSCTSENPSPVEQYRVESLVSHLPTPIV